MDLLRRFEEFIPFTGAKTLHDVARVPLTHRLQISDVAQKHRELNRSGFRNTYEVSYRSSGSIFHIIVLFSLNRLMSIVQIHIFISK